jgi:hypothetical protein
LTRLESDADAPRQNLRAPSKGAQEMSITNSSGNISTTNSSSNALFSEADRALLIQIRIAPFLVMFSCSFFIVFLIAIRRCTRKVPSAALIDAVASRGDIIPVSQEQVFRVDFYDL